MTRPSRRPVSGPKAWKRIAAYASRLAPRYERAFLAAIDAVQGRLRRSDIVRLIASGRIDELVDAALRATDGLEDFRQVVQATLVETATDAAIDVSRQARAAVRFDAYAPLAVQVVQREGARFVREVRNDVRQTVRRVVAEGIRRGDNPRTTARVLRGSIGLTQRQQEAVANYRALLEVGDRDALRRALRDRRFDASARAAVNGERLPAGRIDEMVGRYEARYLKYRAEVIARHESMVALSQGNRLAWEQAIADGVVSRATLERQWFTAADERTCPYCRPVHLQVRAFDAAFDTPLGPATNAPLHVQCRCVVFTRPGRSVTPDAARIRQPVWQRDATRVDVRKVVQRARRGLAARHARR